MIDWAIVNMLLQSGKLSSFSYEESDDGKKSFSLSFRPSSNTDVVNAGVPLQYNDADPMGPVFQSFKAQLQAMYAHTGAPVSDEDVIQYMRANGVLPNT